MEIKLRQIRENRGMTQQQLAEYLNISQSQYYRKEKGISKITDEEWDIIAKIFNVNKDVIQTENSLFKNNSELKGKIIHSEELLQTNNELVSELREHLSTLKEKIIFVKNQYELRIKDKEDLILVLKNNSDRYIK